MRSFRGDFCDCRGCKCVFTSDVAKTLYFTIVRSVSFMSVQSLKSITRALWSSPQKSTTTVHLLELHSQEKYRSRSSKRTQAVTSPSLVCF